jgi:hypothetical protein
MEKLGSEKVASNDRLVILGFFIVILFNLYILFK